MKRESRIKASLKHCLKKKKKREKSNKGKAEVEVLFFFA